jgi:hypothetical protein
MNIVVGDGVASDRLVTTTPKRVEMPEAVSILDIMHCFL